ncbi:hypothetical protein QYE76_053751 [Lolium multiflorum]|uniref:Cytochrome c oxidase subunit Vb n=1 Tax=Lolium multiflorum TaxID=4521 RepID=A0AAD8SWZ6_LOLMU|nr:hypothetical protein QYE76_053751 [Lolium multiflorum]
MWRRLQTLAPALRRAAAAAGAAAAPTPITARAAPFSTAAAAFRRTTPLSSGDKPLTVEDIVPIATGHEREELEGYLQGKKRFDMDAPYGPFGTKDSPFLKATMTISREAAAKKRHGGRADWKMRRDFGGVDANQGKPWDPTEPDDAEAPAVIESYYDKRIVGCPGAGGEDEHDVVWFWLKKDEPHECPVCSQYFTLKVIGDGGNPDGHDTDDEGHHH